MPDANTKINTRINNDGKNDLADEPDQADETRPTEKQQRDTRLGR